MRHDGGVRRRARVFIVLAGLLPLLVAATDTSVHAGPRHVSTRHLAPGVVLSIMHTSTPEQIRVITLSQGHDAHVDLLPAGPSYPAYRHPSAIGASSGALAIVNGDFGWDGKPKHLTMINGEIWTTGVQRGAEFAMSSNGKRAFVGSTHAVIRVNVPGGARLSVASMNAGRPRRSAIAAFSARGGSVEQPPGTPTPGPRDPQWCAARLTPTSRISWSGHSKHGLMRSYHVASQPQPCPKKRLPVGSTAGSVVLAAREAGSGGRAIRALQAGDAVRLNWTIAGWPGVLDVVGGTPMLVRRGKNVGPPFHPGDPYFYGRNPRTAVGITKGCTDERNATECDTFIVTDDGRQSGWSVGMELPSIAGVLLHLGAVDGMNLDGGGGTVMWVRKRGPSYCQGPGDAGGCLVNRPSDANGERPSVLGLAVTRSRGSGPH